MTLCIYKYVGLAGNTAEKRLRMHRKNEDGEH